MKSIVIHSGYASIVSVSSYNYQTSARAYKKKNSDIDIRCAFPLLKNEEKEEIKTLILTHFFDSLDLARPKHLPIPEYKNLLDQTSLRHCLICLAALHQQQDSSFYDDFWTKTEELLLFFRLQFFYDLSDVISLSQVNNLPFIRHHLNKISQEDIKLVEQLKGRRPTFLMKIPISEYTPLLDKQIFISVNGFFLIDLQGIRDWIIPFEYKKRLSSLLEHTKQIIQDNPTVTPDSLLDFYSEAINYLKSYSEKKLHHSVQIYQNLPDIEDLASQNSLFPLCQRLHLKRLCEKPDPKRPSPLHEHRTPHHLYYPERIDSRSFLLDIQYTTKDIIGFWEDYFLKDGRTSKHLFDTKYAPNAVSNLLSHDNRLLSKGCQKRTKEIGTIGCPYKYLAEDDLRQLLQCSDEALSNIIQNIRQEKFTQACAIEFEGTHKKKPKYEISHPLSYVKQVLF